MVAITVIGILMTVSVAAFVKRNEAQKLQVATNMISRHVLVTRHKAVSTRRDYRIEINYATSAFRILCESSPGVWELDPPGNNYELPNGIIVSATSEPSDGTIVIERNGTVASDDLPAAIRMKDRHNRLKRIEIYKTGTVRESSLW